MADKYPHYDINISGASDIWDRGNAGAILTSEFFPAELPPVGNYLYKGAGLRSQIYRGNKTDTEIYKGAGQLFQ